MNEEIIAKARAAKSPEELLKTAHENGIDLTEESAKSYFGLVHKSGELTDEELLNAAGAGCMKDGMWLVGDKAEACEHFICILCEKSLSECTCNAVKTCTWCRYCGDFYHDPSVGLIGARICKKLSQQLP